MFSNASVLCGERIDSFKTPIHVQDEGETPVVVLPGEGALQGTNLPGIQQGGRGEVGENVDVLMHVFLVEELVRPDHQSGALPLPFRNVLEGGRFLRRPGRIPFEQLLDIALDLAEDSLKNDVEAVEVLPRVFHLPVHLRGQVFLQGDPPPGVPEAENVLDEGHHEAVALHMGLLPEKMDERVVPVGELVTSVEIVRSFPWARSP